MLATLCAKCDITRDSSLWLWGKILSVAALITSGALDLPYWAGYLGMKVTTTEIHWAQTLAVVALYLSGQYSTSALEGKKLNEK